MDKGAPERTEINSSRTRRQAERGSELGHTEIDREHLGVVRETMQAEKRGDRDQPEGRAKNKRRDGIAGHTEEAGNNAWRGGRDSSTRERRSASSRRSRRNH